MLFGEYEHTIDEKHRVTLPARFRDVLAQGVVATRGLDRCVVLYTGESWDTLVEQRLEDLDPFSKEGRQLQRYMFSNATPSKPDRQGRLLLPSGLIEHAGITREVVVAGLRDHVEIWDRAAWRAQIEEVLNNVELAAERLATSE
jgi:MraZ protein